MKLDHFPYMQIAFFARLDCLNQSAPSSLSESHLFSLTLKVQTSKAQYISVDLSR